MKLLEINLSKDVQDLCTTKHYRKKLKKIWLNEEIYCVRELNESVLRLQIF